VAARAGQQELDRMQRMGLLPLGVFQRLRASYQGVIARSEKQLRDLLVAHSAEEARQSMVVRQRLLAVEKSAIKDAANSGMLSEETAARLAVEIDRSLAETGEDEGRE
jgi:hypothetical protein